LRYSTEPLSAQVIRNFQSKLNGKYFVSSQSVDTKKVERIRRIADSLTDPKDAKIVREYAAELAAMVR